MKDTIKLHYGKCRIQRFWSLTRTKDEKSEYRCLFSYSVSCDSLNFSIALTCTRRFSCTTILLQQGFAESSDTDIPVG